MPYFSSEPFGIFREPKLSKKKNKEDQLHLLTLFQVVSKNANSRKSI
jgi:hypothetical protein